MKKDNSLLLVIIGLIIYITLQIIDRFFMKIDPYIYIPVSLLGILYVIFGIIKDKKRKIK